MDWNSDENINYESKTAAPLTESQLRGLVESAPFPIGVYIGIEMRIQFANQKILDTWGKGNDVVGKTYREVLPELENTGIYEQLASVYTTGVAYHARYQRVDLTIDGVLRPFYFNYSFTPLIDENGQIYGVMNTAADVSELAFANQRIAASEHRFRSLIAESPVATCLFTGPDMLIEVANDMMIKFWGKGDSVIGKTIREALPELEGQPFFGLLDEVYRTGIDYRTKNGEAKLLIDGKMQTFYFDYTYKALRDENGNVYGIMDVAVDVTEQVLNRRKLEESERNFRSLVLQAPVGICIVSGDQATTEIVNDKFLEIVGRKHHEIENIPYWEAIPEAAAIYKPILSYVFESGKPYHGDSHRIELIRNGIEEDVYIDFVYHPLKNEDGDISRVMILATNVTQQAIAHRETEQSEQRFRSLIAAAPVGIAVFAGPELVVETHNQAFLTILGKGNTIQGLPLRDAMPELVSEQQPYLEILKEVYRTGKMYQHSGVLISIVKNGITTDNYYDLTYTPLFDEHGEVYAILDIVIDVTENVLAQKRIRESEKNLRNTILQAPVAMCILRGPRFVVEIANERMLEIWGKSGGETLSKPLFDGIPEIQGQGFEQLLTDVFITGKTFKANEVAVSVPRGETMLQIYIDFVYEAFREPDGSISGIMVVAIDVTDQLMARKKIEQAEEKARLAIESADLGTYEIDLTTEELTTSPRFNYIWGIEGEDLITRSMIAERLHPDDKKIRTDAHLEAIRTGNLHYEGRVIREDGQTHWVRVKGKLIYDENGRARTLIGIIQDITEQKEFAEQLTHLVKERTIELHRSNDDLLQFAHVASHDLKEPVRKIKFFSSMLDDEFGNLLPERGKMHLSKVQTAADRMFSMIEGVLSFSAISSSEQSIEKVDLNEIITNIESDLEVVIEQKQATIEREKLPSVEGASVLLYQLFYNIINNSLKFSKPDLPPRIRLSAVEISENGIDLVQIVVADNGIGLDPNYTNKIFNAFARLHSKDKYEGTGLGLALCKKIVERHHGTISATGIKNESAIITITLPVKQLHHNI